MCGIIGVASKQKDAVQKALYSLKLLDYRGYDSAGIAYLDNGKIEIKKGAGKIDEVFKKFNVLALKSSVTIGHTRWATHGSVNDRNAHPIADCNGKVAVVHNGTISNFLSIKEELESKGHKFATETDTEVIPHIFEESLHKNSFIAFKNTVSKLKDSYAILMIIEGENRIYFAKCDNPLVIGLSKEGNFISSDVQSLSPYTNEFVILKDGDLGYISSDDIYIENSGIKVDIKKRKKIVKMNNYSLGKEEYAHYMLKEIHESGKAAQLTVTHLSKERGFEKAIDKINSYNRIIITGSGSSYHSGLFFSLLLQRSGYNAQALISSEYYNLKLSSKDLVIAISQSGETLDVIKAVKKFKEEGAFSISITNTEANALSRISNINLHTYAGPEIGVAATKTFTAQISAFMLLYKRLVNADYSNLSNISNAINLGLSHEKDAISIGKELAEHRNIYFLGRGIDLPLALEGALKVKEVSYVHAEGYPAGESKHGPIALVYPGFPVVFIKSERLTEEIKNNVKEMEARGAITYALSANTTIGARKELIIAQDDELSIFSLLPIIQLIAYYSAIAKGIDPDKPRNLAKTVTVE
ncbi:MAG: glutamine--fructose-6-phosphate transaminase (isomerizing) [Candidatus Parvarchaeota archaeon]|nr:glutamine--fructose-6-phosphate transaminase (isomerizing) [Candidatus Rehaiarchaeum fermentans]